MEYASGYFTVERNIIGSDLNEIESKLGFQQGRLALGARVLALLRQPAAGEFAFAGSTRYSGARGLVQLRQRLNFPVPHAWFGQRLIKVVPNDSGPDSYPPATTPVEQWQLLVQIPAKVVCELNLRQKYWPRP
jgi:hypothetical protein